MNFMRDDEYLLLMNLGTHQLQGTPILSSSDRERLRNVGIRTAVEFPEWGELEPERDNYNFAIIEHILSINRSVGMKTLFSVPGPFLPTWIPNEWRNKYAN